MAFEADAAESWIFNRLATDEELIALGVADRIYRAQAPQGAQYPLVLFNMQAASDLNGLGTCRVKADLVYQIKVISKGAPAELDRQIDYRIDRLFQVASAAQHELARQESTETITEQWVITSRRGSIVNVAENDVQSKQLFFHRGGLFRLHIHPLTAEV